MGDEISYIPILLRRNYSESSAGFDLDQQNGVSATESLEDLRAARPDHFLREEDWLAYYQRNQAVIRQRVPFFRWGAGLSANNPIHELLAREAELYPAQRVRRTYQFIAQVLQEVRRTVRRNPDLSPQGKIATVFRILERRCHDREETPTLNGGLGARRCHLDCDTASWITLSIAHEMGWPLHGVLLPKHFFVRWEDSNGLRFNMDYNLSPPYQWGDIQYQRAFWVTDDEIANRVYLVNLNREELMATFEFGVAGGLARRGNIQGAISAFDRVIELNPRFPEAYTNRGMLYDSMGDYERALEDVDQAIDLFPRYIRLHYHRAIILHHLGRDEDAVASLNRAVHRLEEYQEMRSSPSALPVIFHAEDYVELFFKRAELNVRIARYEDALEDIVRLERLGVRDIELNLLHLRAVRQHQLSPRRTAEIRLEAQYDSLSNAPGVGGYVGLASQSGRPWQIGGGVNVRQMFGRQANTQILGEASLRYRLRNAFYLQALAQGGVTINTAQGGVAPLLGGGARFIWDPSGYNREIGLQGFAGVSVLCDPRAGNCGVQAQVGVQVDFPF